MTKELEGKDQSLWIATTPRTGYPKLINDETVYDVAIVGGGITGIVSAYHMQQRGLKVVLVEGARLVEWTSGETTAKLSSQHYLIYDYLINHQGEEVAKVFADANQAGIDEVEIISKKLGIDCEFERKDAYVYTRDLKKVGEIRAEVEAAQKIGLPASFEAEIDLPFEVAGAVRFRNQAQFHPRKFLLGVAKFFVDNGGVIYELTEAVDIESSEPSVVKTKLGDIKAKVVLEASGAPFWKKDIFDGFMWEKASYALAVTLKDGERYPSSLYITTDEPLRSIRSARFEGRPVMIFGGESHEYHDETFDDDMKLHFGNLITDVYQRYNVDKILFRWLASDQMPYDRMPYIGKIPGEKSIYVITGYRAWGLAWAMSATKAIANDIAGQPEEWVKHFSLDRLSIPLKDSDRNQEL